ncbi:MAG TPA: hypothetical protein VMR52_11670 [Dehalococcoidia bacterium]|nr:hypothetical protein [Dehalococcoidia bacterium]
MSTVKELKSLAPGLTAAFTAKVLRLWEVGGLRMALVGDPTGLMRMELGDARLEEGASYEFRRASVQQYPGGWTSVSLAAGGEILPTGDVPVPQDPSYIERTFKILSGIQRKKGRCEGRLPAWRHPAPGD